MSDETANKRDCRHGLLARSCQLCESEREIAELERAHLAAVATIAALTKDRDELHAWKEDVKNAFRMTMDKACRGDVELDPTLVPPISEIIQTLHDYLPAKPEGDAT